MTEPRYLGGNRAAPRKPVILDETSDIDEWGYTTREQPNQARMEERYETLILICLVVALVALIVFVFKWVGMP